MDNQGYVQCIVEGMELYFRTFGLASNMQHHSGDIEWISPLPNAAGPSLVYRVSLNAETVIHRVDEIIQDIQAKRTPSLWVISPTSTPENISALLLSKGFRELSDSEHPEPEPGMALDFTWMSPSIQINPNVDVQTVKTASEFAIWIEVVNEALHGWPMLTVEHYSRWISCRELTFYLAYMNRIPVATVSTIQDGDRASIEFVSTLKEFRKQGAAITICMEALRDLQRKCVNTVTLRSSYEAIPLYAKLGFRSFYDQRLFSYQIL